MESFEKHLRDNKSQMDLNKVNPEIWLSIENKMLQQKNRNHRLSIRWLSIAAAAVLLLLILDVFFWRTPTIRPAELLAKNGLHTEQFTQQMTLKTQSLAKAQIPIDQKEDFDLLLRQLEFLDAQYHDYLQYIEQNGYQHFIGKQILNYYETKIELLDKIQQDIEKIEYYEKKYHKESPKVKLNI